MIILSTCPKCNLAIYKPNEKAKGPHCRCGQTPKQPGATTIKK